MWRSSENDLLVKQLYWLPHLNFLPAQWYDFQFLQCLLFTVTLIGTLKPKMENKCTEQTASSLELPSNLMVGLGPSSTEVLETHLNWIRCLVCEAKLRPWSPTCGERNKNGRCHTAGPASASINSPVANAVLCAITTQGTELSSYTSAAWGCWNQHKMLFFMNLIKSRSWK